MEILHDRAATAKGCGPSSDGPLSRFLYLRQPVENRPDFGEPVRDWGFRLSGRPMRRTEKGKPSPSPSPREKRHAGRSPSFRPLLLARQDDCSEERAIRHREIQMVVAFERNAGVRR